MSGWAVCFLVTLRSQKHIEDQLLSFLTLVCHNTKSDDGSRPWATARDHRAVSSRTLGGSSKTSASVSRRSASRGSKTDPGGKRCRATTCSGHAACPKTCFPAFSGGSEPQRFGPAPPQFACRNRNSA